MKNFRFTSLWMVLIIGFTLSSCEKEDPANSTSPPPFDLHGIDASFMANIPYDGHGQTNFDIFMPASSSPTGLVIYIHGGAFVFGDKNNFYSVGPWDYPEEIRTLLANGVAVASINYRLLQNNETEGVIKPIKDAQRALQYIRSNASQYNIDPQRIALSGISAGAGISLWIATHDDMQDPGNPDPILRASTRVVGIALRETQASYNIEDRWMNDVFGEYSLSWTDLSTQFQGSLLQFYGVSSMTEYESAAIDAYRENVDMLHMLTSDDPELFVENTLTPVLTPSNTDLLFHHAYHARELRERADEVGVDHICYYGLDGDLYSDPSNETFTAFLIRKINE